jgi:hypothetical protein
MNHKSKKTLRKRHLDANEYYNGSAWVPRPTGVVFPTAGSATGPIFSSGATPGPEFRRDRRRDARPHAGGAGLAGLLLRFQGQAAPSGRLASRRGEQGGRRQRMVGRTLDAGQGRNRRRCRRRRALYLRATQGQCARSLSRQGQSRGQGFERHCHRRRELIAPPGAAEVAQ